MEFTVNKADLVRELGLSQGVVEKKTTIPILSNVLLVADENGLTVTATDLELGIRSTCPARVKTAGAGTIPAKRLLDYVRLLPDADVTIKFMENQWANLTCGRSKTRIAGMSRESYPQLPPTPEPIVDLPAALLASMITRTIFAISNEESRFTLNGAQLILKPESVTMVATDGHRLALVEEKTSLEGIEGVYKALLPKKAMTEILKLASDAGAEGKITFSGDDNHLFFRFGSRLLISRKLSGNFPDFERVLPKDHAFAVNMAKDELKATIERVAQFSDDRSRAIRLQVSPGEVKIYSSLSETGESEESIPVDYAGPLVEIGFNASYMIEFLRALPTPEAKFLFKDGQSAGEMQPGEESEKLTYRYVVMPMRI
ncbi:MAG: DNA polymerase III subunit beta [Bryobacteraceae bacterium]|nr:DNA polymerase III subunit beta [Bryobacteraceae bacterium]